MSLIKPLLKDGEFLEDIKNTENDTGSFHLWWLGQSGYLIQWNDKYLLIDPYLSDSLTEKYRHTEKPHTRMTELVINPVHLDFIDVVTSSHNHTDHLDGETLIPLLNQNPNIRMVIPEANRSFVADRLKRNENFFTGLNDGNSVEISGFRITGIPAAHEDLSRDEQGNCHYLGYVFSFGNYCIYHSGDTIWHEDIVEALKPFNIDVAILPINGSDPKRKVAGNLNAKEAVKMAKLIKAKLLIPCHYDMFTFNTADPQEFAEIAKRENQSFRVLQCGERFTPTS